MEVSPLDDTSVVGAKRGRGRPKGSTKMSTREQAPLRSSLRTELPLHGYHTRKRGLSVQFSLPTEKKARTLPQLVPLKRSSRDRRSPDRYKPG